MATKSKSIYVAVAAVPLLVALAVFLHTFSPSPLPMPKPYEGPLPSATPPKEIAVYSVVAGVNHRVAAFGYRGGSLFERREFSMAGAFVKHPKGDLLIDTGFGRNIDEQFRTLPFLVRANECTGMPFIAELAAATSSIVTTGTLSLSTSGTMPWPAIA